MKVPRNLSGADLVKGLARVGYVVTRQRGSHIRLTRKQDGEHHVTVPNHDALRIGTLADILSQLADNLGVEKEQLLKSMFD